MKKPKNLLSRSFNPIKCKTSLRLASSRLKLLRNKKDVQVKQMKREIAQLLESGQDQTAQIRVEHVMREEKTMAAYDLLEIYCELIIARMPIIEFQKDCPIDLKEAIASIVFSSLRCGDVPELLDVRKQISAKYGKEFVTAAIELRPMCGVGRLLVEKLSAAAPDGQSKIKILNAIAEEHNVKWDYKSFEEKDSSGPTPIRKASDPHSETPRFEAAVHDTKISLGEEKLSSGQAEARPPAHAAASSAEQASVAAAELSNHGGTSTIEPPKSDVYNIKAEGLEGPPNLNSFEQKIEASANVSSSVHTEVDVCEPDPMTSSRFEASGDDSLHHGSPFADDYIQKREESSAEQAGMAAAELSNHGGTSTIEPPKSDVKAEGLEGPPSLNSFEQKIEASANISTSVHTEVDGCETSSRFEASGDDSLYHGSPFAHDDYIQKKEESEGEMDVKKHSLIYETEAENLGEGNFVNEPHEPDALSLDKSDLEVDGHGPAYDEQDLEEFNLAQKSLSDSSSPRSSSSNVVNSFLDVSENPTLRDDDDNFTPLTFDDDSSDEDMNVSLPSIQQHSEIDSSLGSEDSQIESKEEDISNESRLNFGKLTGGLRHKRHNHFPPVFKNNASIATTSTSSTTPSLVEQPTIVTTQHKKKSSGKSHLYSDSDSDTCDEEEEQPTIVTMQHKKKSSGKSHLNFDSDSDTCEEEEEEEEEVLQPDIKLNLGASYSELYSDDSDLDEDFPKVSHSKKSHLQSGISRRTKASSSSSGSVRSQALDSNGTSETPEANETSSGKSDNCKQPISVVASVKTNSGKASYNTVQEPKISKPENNALTATTIVTMQHKKKSSGKSHFNSDSDSDTCEEEEEEILQPEIKLNLGSSYSEFYSDDSDLDEDFPKVSHSRKSHLKAPSSSSGSVRSETLDSNVISETPEANETSSGKSDNCKQPISVTASVETNSGKASHNTVQEPKISTPEKKASHVHPKLPDYDALVQSLRINTS